jgi:aerotaxis receptor
MTTSFDMFIETEVPQGELIISRTDLDGNITYVNDVFAQISGYEPDELIGKPHNIIRHPDMPKSAFKELWDTIKQGKTWEGYVKNLRKDNGYYWVYASISPLYKDGKIVEYKSVREPVSREKKIQMQKLYDELRSKEENSSRVVLYISNDKLDEAKKLEES